MKKHKQILILAGATVLLCSPAAQAADANDCRNIDDNAERLACYDKRSAPPPSQPEKRHTVLDDNVGSERLERDEPQADSSEVIGHVSSCDEGPRGKYHFCFDNGQIWQQRDNKAVRWSECDFDVSIEKDFFGYKMTPKGENRSIRISRIK